jgi:hypothetical protein
MSQPRKEETMPGLLIPPCCREIAMSPAPRVHRDRNTSSPVHHITRLDGVLSGPLSSCRLVARTVGLVHVCDFRDERVVWVGIRQHRADAKEHLGDGEGWRPLVSQDVQADATVRVDVRVVYARGEVHLGRLEWVVCGEVDREEEDAA